MDKINRTEEDIKEFMQQIKVMKIKTINGFYRAMLNVIDNGITISYYKFISLHTQIYYAANSLVNAYRTEQKDLWGNISKNPMWERTMHIQNAFTIYDTCYDYTLSIIYFFYDIGKKNHFIKENKDIDSITKYIKGREINKIYYFLKLNNYRLYEVLKQYDSDRRDLHDKANNIKHRAGFSIY